MNFSINFNKEFLNEIEFKNGHFMALNCYIMLKDD